MTDIGHGNGHATVLDQSMVSPWTLALHVITDSSVHSPMPEVSTPARACGTVPGRRGTGPGRRGAILNAVPCVAAMVYGSLAKDFHSQFSVTPPPRVCRDLRSDVSMVFPAHLSAEFSGADSPRFPKTPFPKSPGSRIFAPRFR